MSRYVRDLPTALSADQAAAAATAYLQAEGFVPKEEKGEHVWRKGTGALTAPQFFMVAASNNTVHIEAWMSAMAILPGIYVGEMDPTSGFWGWAVKAVQKKRIQTLEGMLTQGAPGMAAQPTAAVAPGWYPDPHARHELRYWDGASWTNQVSDGGQTSVES